MSKNWMMLTGLLFLGPVATSQAQPLDSPDTVYIDGLPCNSVCQSYMAWSWQHSSTTVAHPPASAQPTRRSSDTEVRRATVTHPENSRPAAHDRAAKQAMPLPAAETAELPPAENAAVGSKPALANVAASLPAGGAAATSNTKTVQEQVAAAKALAERLTFVTTDPMPEQEASNVVASGFTEAVEATDTKSVDSAPTNHRGNMVALLIARPEIKSVSELAGKEVAIEDRRSASNASIRTAIAAAGAAEVQLNEGHTKALDRLVGGEVPAAVLALVSPEAAQWFPDIPGFRIFRVPLAPRH
jgi:hypothetical protein